MNKKNDMQLVSRYKKTQIKILEETIELKDQRIKNLEYELLMYKKNGYKNKGAEKGSLYIGDDGKK